MTARGITAERVVALRLADPARSMSDIARAVGVSKQRVYDILRRNHLRTGQPVKYRCSSCGLRLQSQTKSGMCYRCRHDPLLNPGAYDVKPCAVCGTEIVRTVAYYRHRSYTERRQHTGPFCSHPCRAVGMAAFVRATLAVIGTENLRRGREIRDAKRKARSAGEAG